jgi:hypothetical protein
MTENETVKVGQEEIVIDPSALAFNEATLNEYMQTEGSIYNYFGQRAADAQAQVALAKLNYDVVYAEKFQKYKQGISDKLAEAHAKADPDVVKAAKQIVAVNRVNDKLKNHLRAWDKNHDNAQSLGYMIRKEMDKLNFEIKRSKSQISNDDPDLEKQLEEIVSKRPRPEL